MLWLNPQVHEHAGPNGVQPLLVQQKLLRRNHIVSRPVQFLDDSHFPHNRDGRGQNRHVTRSRRLVEPHGSQQQKHGHQDSEVIRRHQRAPFRILHANFVVQPCNVRDDFLFDGGLEPCSDCTDGFGPRDHVRMHVFHGTQSDELGTDVCEHEMQQWVFVDSFEHFRVRKCGCAVGFVEQVLVHKRECECAEEGVEEERCGAWCQAKHFTQGWRAWRRIGDVAIVVGSNSLVGI